MVKFATVLTDNYVPLFKALIKSLVKNSNFDHEFNIICSDRLNLISRGELDKVYSKINYIDIDDREWEAIGKNNPRFWSIEAFNIEADTVIFMDSDLLCLKDISDLFIETDVIKMARECRRPCFNAGFMIIGRPFLNKKTYKKLKNFTAPAEGYGTDQKIYNILFSGKIEPISNDFNTLVTEIQEMSDIHLLHYIHKPFTKTGKSRISKSLVHLWEQYYNG